MPPMGASGTIGSQHLALRDQVLAAAPAHHRRRLPPGERLTEDRLAADFGVSRNPVREALRVVEAEGLIEIQPRRGAVVATPDARTMRDMFAARACLEPLAARLAAERATAQEVAACGLLDDARVATEQDDFVRVAELNSALHHAVIT